MAWRHAHEFATTIPRTAVYESPAPWHLLRYGADREGLRAAVKTFLGTGGLRPALLSSRKHASRRHASDATPGSPLMRGHEYPSLLVGHAAVGTARGIGGHPARALESAEKTKHRRSDNRARADQSPPVTVWSHAPI